MPATKRKIHGWFTTDGKLVRASKIVAARNAAERMRQAVKGQKDVASEQRNGDTSKPGPSQELLNDQRKGSAAGSDFISPPLDLWQFAKLLEVNGPQYRAVTAKALDSVGKGWKLVKVEDSAKESDGNVLRAFFNSPTRSLPKMSLTDMMVCLVKDFESVGNFGLEVVVDPQGMPLELNHIAAKTLRVKDNFEVIAQVRNGRRTYFQTWGAEKFVDKSSGNQSLDLDFPKRGNLMLYRRKYHPASDWYGLPDILPEVGAVSLDISARDFNIDFFENGAIPAYVVIVEGGELDEETEILLEDFFHNEMKGEGNQHRTMVLPIPSSEIKVKIEKIQTEIKDGHFKNLRADNRDAILSANGVPPIRAFYFQTTGLGRDVSKKLDEIYRDSTIHPLQQIVEQMFNEDIIAGMFQIKGWAFKLKDLELIEREPTANVIEKLSRSKMVTKNELRRIGSDLVPGGLEAMEGGDELPGNGPVPPEFGGGKAGAKSWRDVDYTALFTRCRHVEYDDLEEDLKRAVELKAMGAKQADVVRSQVRSSARAVGDMTKGVDKALKAQEELVKENFDRAADGSFFGKAVRRIASDWFGMKADPVRINAVLKDIDGTSEEIAEEIEQGKTKGAELGARAAGVTTGLEVTFSLDQPAVRQFLVDQSEKIAADITRVTSERIRNTLARGIQAGESNEKLAKRVARVFETRKSRAKMIARTETADAFNFGKVKASADRGIALFDVFDVGGPGDDGCVAANGKRWTAEQALSNRLEHPNCVRAFTPVPRSEE